MIEYCYRCQKTHDHHTWTRDNVGWYCKAVSSVHEWVPESVKDDRKKYLKSIIQPYRDGVPSKEFIQSYPQRANTVFTLEQRQQAKNVWTDLPNYKNLDKTL